MKIEFRRLTEVSRNEIIDLMNSPLVRRQMPLLSYDFDESICDQFIEAKERIWNEYGYGPWAFIVKGQFAGWGGLQPENGDVDLAIVLHPDYWGLGKIIYTQIINKAFNEMSLTSITVLFPTSRTRIKGLLKIGFEKETEVIIGNQQFIRYRIENPLTKLLNNK
ncbi:GNAT family N-acetyltransferase [Lutibacter maritimus]|uniref:Acetyltransferase (GNAT) domain-containing protein n=1 Tax=Lutibacter maritimus TaxID=593133 RepID=A0A1I6RYD3_9FLAO|nr:GNAT family N-acetyltransferase [Lutibacter maritimus]SFS69702.1 Acetyltransferase (GNAT) domain-containing protein [Lutibacter maritimus]